MAALGGIAHAVALGGLLDFCGVGEMLTEALAKRRAEIAAEVDARGIDPHFLENFFQCIYNSGSGIDQRSVHVKQDGVIMQHDLFPFRFLSTQLIV